MTPRWCALLGGLMLGLAALTGHAWADCEDGVTALEPKVARIADPHLRALLQIDLRKAQYEMWEFDEVECAVVLEHAAKLLKLGL